MTAEDEHTREQQQNVRLNDPKHHLFYLWHMKNHEASITFHKKTWHLFY